MSKGFSGNLVGLYITQYLSTHLIINLYHVFSNTKCNLPGIIRIARTKYSVKRGGKNGETGSFRIGEGKTLRFSSRYLDSHIKYFCLFFLFRCHLPSSNLFFRFSLL